MSDAFFGWFFLAIIDRSLEPCRKANLTSEQVIEFGHAPIDEWRLSMKGQDPETAHKRLGFVDRRRGERARRVAINSWRGLRVHKLENAGRRSEGRPLYSWAIDEGPGPGKGAQKARVC
jgi:hypothetical protein